MEKHRRTNVFDSMESNVKICQGSINLLYLAWQKLN